MQIALKASNVVHTLEEMKTLTQELLTSNPSSDTPPWPAHALPEQL